MRRKTFILLGIILGLLCSYSFAFASQSIVSADHFSLIDENQNLITMCGRELDPGDRYIASDNKVYEVVSIEGQTVSVEYKETIELPEITEELLSAQVGKADQANGIVGIYHTHNAESYVPSSGTDSKDNGQGDVLQVGKVLADALENQGVEVYWSDHSHLPHDGQAYNRSRRTALELLQKNPDTLIDVHRDATPPEVYETEIEGQPTTKVRIVVGRQNQNRASNLEYAKRIKAVADKFYPGIIEGIFDARGNYNQDLGPKMILLEFGAHTNSLEQAEKAAEFFAKVIPAAAGLTPSTKKPANEQIDQASNRSLVWLISGALVIGAIFLLISQGKIGSPLDFLLRESGLKNSPEDDDQDK